MNRIKLIAKDYLKESIPEFNVGDEVKVNVSAPGPK